MARHLSPRAAPVRRPWHLALAAVVASGLALLLGTTPAAGVIPGQQPPGPTPKVEQDVKEFVLPLTGVQPESVVYDEGTQSFYASSFLGGSITKVTYPEGRTSVFTPPGQGGQIESDGLAVDGKGRLYVAGGVTGTINVYDLGTAERVASFSTPLGLRFTNDVVVAPNGDVYATDSFRPAIFRVTAAQVDAGQGTPEQIDLSPEVNGTGINLANPPKPFNANGIRFTPDGKFILFDDLNDSALFRMTVPPVGQPAKREIRKLAIEGGSLGDPDGLEFDGKDLLVVDNGGERLLKVELSKDYLKAKIVSATTSPLFRTPTAAALTPDGRVLVSQAELFDTDGPPYAVTSIPRP